jgi:hypothetical protein
VTDPTTAEATRILLDTGKALAEPTEIRVEHLDDTAGYGQAPA